MRTLTTDEVKNLGLTPMEKYALVDKSKNSVFIVSSSKESLEETHQKMKDTGHPKAGDMELVAQP